MAWREELHPRDLANGEFTDKGGGDWVQKLSDTIGGASFEQRVAAANGFTGIHNYSSLPHEGRHTEEPEGSITRQYDPGFNGPNSVRHGYVTGIDKLLATQAKADYWSYYPHINAPLRGQPVPPSARGHVPNLTHEQAVQALDQMMAPSVFQGDAVRYRLVDGQTLDSLGDQWTDPAFISAGPEHHVRPLVKMWNLPDPVMLRILVPAGTHGIELHYNETLLQRGLRFRKVAEHKPVRIGKIKVRQVDVEVIPG